ncbi:CAP domain-containing protein [Ornithinibacillus contaminans]|uniref:CAP domain-containing protein n=1 Tax=Ornithinibacillus contaminans TaxID=694055 RepID=UPI00064DF4EF|nr:CAP domain-containing protein [Ornithinibacillus contaminans]
MFKKIGIITALSTAMIFGTGFDKADVEATNSMNHKFYYSINGENGSLIGKDAQSKINDLIHQLMEKYHITINWPELNDKQVNKEHPVAKEEPAQNEQASQKEETVKEPVAQDPAEEQTQATAPEKEQEKAPEQVATPAPTPAPEQGQGKPNDQAKEENNSQSQQSALSQFEQKVVELTNQERQKNGLAPLQMDTELSKVAKEKSRDMAANNYFDHNSPNYGSPFDMMKSFGITYRTAGENIAKGQSTPEQVVNAWMNSAGHRANILNGNFTHIGVGYVEQGNYWTQQFIGK